MDSVNEIRNPAAEDRATEAAVLQQLLALYPAQLTLEELSREIGGEKGGFALMDAVERAVRELTATGLVHRNGDVVLPSRSALRFDELLG
jgi:predicted transcriptional regulator